MWLPIETAPRDGTPILGYEVRFVPRVLFWRGDGWRDVSGCYMLPTSWMPLPEPPAATLPGGQEK